MFKYTLGTHPGEGVGEQTPPPSPRKCYLCRWPTPSVSVVLFSQLDLMLSLSPCS